MRDLCSFALGLGVAVLAVVTAGSARAGPTPRAILGEQSTLVVLLNYQDDQREPLTPDDVADWLFNAQNPDSMNSYFQEISYGKASFSGVVLDWVTLPVARTECFDYVSIQDAASVQQTVDLIDPLVDFSLFTRLILYELSPVCQGVCGACGNFEETSVSTNEGDFDLSVTRSTIDPSQTPLIQSRTMAHEVGHALGLQHAHDLECGDEIVGDIPADCESVRGYEFDAMDRSQLRGHFNSSYKEILCWFDPGNIVKVAAGTHDIVLRPLELPTNGPQMIKIPVAYTAPHGGNTSYYVIEYRQSIGFDAIFSNFNDPGTGILVHLGPESGFPWPQTHLLDMSPHTNASNADQIADSRDADLKLGERYDDLQNNVSIVFTGLNAEGAIITVTVGTGDGAVTSGDQCDNVSPLPPTINQ